MAEKRTLILKRHGTIVYTIKMGENVLWEGKDVHEVYPKLTTTYKDRELTIHWKDKEESGVVK